MRLLRLACLLLLAAPAMQAQTLWEIGIQGGATAYTGDLNAQRFFDVSMSRGAYGALVRRNVHPNLAFRLNMLGGIIAGDEGHFSAPSWRPERGFSFETTFYEADLLFEYDVWAHRRTRDMAFHKTISPYLYVGPGWVFFDAKTDYNNQQEPNPVVRAELIAQDAAHSGFSNQLSWVFGGGVKLDLSRKVVLAADIGLRKVKSDMLDGVAASGNSAVPDWFMYGSISITRRLYQPDSDRDFIPNHKDACPLLAGPRYMDGCPDADGDGITDGDDACPLIPGVASARGCPDADGDGTQDSLDICPGVPGPVKTFGCPDYDQDGIRDAVDLCPYTAGLRSQGGCPDTDGDGVPDGRDACPGEGGLVNAAGCPDADQDGLVDSLDQCPDKAGIAEFNGCPDTDGDGIEDSRDACPDVPGMATFMGCPDTDGDGIEDEKDACPEQAGTYAFNGCPDTDGDGIEDREDRCPEARGSKANKGCPEITVEDKKELNLSVKQVQFETGSDKLTANSLVILDKAVAILKKYPNYRVRIEGYTDSVGKASSNLQLSERRAASCLDYLFEKGIEKDRLSSKGFGESKPIASNKTSSGRAKNRRVEFKLELIK